MDAERVGWVYPEVLGESAVCGDNPMEVCEGFVTGRSVTASARTVEAVGAFERVEGVEAVEGVEGVERVEAVEGVEAVETAISDETLAEDSIAVGEDVACQRSPRVMTNATAAAADEAVRMRRMRRRRSAAARRAMWRFMRVSRMSGAEASAALRDC